MVHKAEEGKCNLKTTSNGICFAAPGTTFYRQSPRSESPLGSEQGRSVVLELVA